MREAMMKENDITTEETFFSISISDAIAVIRLESCPIVNGVNLFSKERFLFQLKKITINNDIKVIIFIFLKNNPECDFFELDNNSNSISKRKYVSRLHSAIDQYIRLIAESDKITIFVDKRKESNSLLNIGLACDYRIVANDACIKNPYFSKAIIPKGGDIFFLRKIMGYRRLFNYLLLNSELDLKEALEIGIIDEVVNLEDIEDAAYKRAKAFAKNPFHYIAGVKKLLNTNIDSLPNFLELENRIIIQDYNRRKCL